MLPSGSKKPPPSSKPLRRGRACVNCRFLKIKCDGIKPVCGPCERNPKEDECDYTDVQGRSRTKVLEDTISRLESRLRELENPHESTPSVTLHDPYSTYNQSHQLSFSSPDSPAGPFSPTSSASSPPFGSSDSSSASSTHPDSGASFLGAEEPPLLIIQTLLDNFLPHASQFGFFLHPTRFRNSALLQLNFGNPSRPSPALLSAAYLWGVHLSLTEPLASHLDVFLSRALKHAGSELAGLTKHPQRVLHLMQAEVLLAYYFFRSGQFLEAKCHAGVAVSLALGCNFHRIRTSQQIPPSTIGVLLSTPVPPLPPQDELDQGERINGFWAVFTLHKAFAVALDPPASLCGALEAPGIQIDTPWPLDITSYREGFPPEGPPSSWTVREFLIEFPRIAEGEFTPAAMLVKGAILFHRAAHLSGQWRPNMQQHEAHYFSNAFQSLDRLIHRFRADLPPLSNFTSSTPSETRTHIVTRALGEAAMIKLHGNFAYLDTASKQKCLSAARAIVGMGVTHLHDLTFVNPIVGALWSIACQFFIDETSRLRAQEGSTTPTASISGEEALLSSLRDGMAALAHFANESPLIRYQLTRIQGSYGVI